jgi:hypothetical protein
MLGLMMRKSDLLILRKTETKENKTIGRIYEICQLYRSQIVEDNEPKMMTMMRLQLRINVRLIEDKEALLVYGKILGSEELNRNISTRITYPPPNSVENQTFRSS